MAELRRESVSWGETCTGCSSLFQQATFGCKSNSPISLTPPPTGLRLLSPLCFCLPEDPAGVIVWDLRLKFLFLFFCPQAANRWLNMLFSGGLS